MAYVYYTYLTNIENKIYKSQFSGRFLLSPK